MRREINQSHSQLDLFQPPAIRPAWQTLPLEVQHKLRPLLLQLFRQAPCNAGTSQKKEDRDE